MEQGFDEGRAGNFRNAQGHPRADLAPAPASGIPSFDMGELREITARLMKNV